MEQKIKTLRRGFTLVEMVIVIAIIAIISAIFVPALSGYLTRSRLNTANADARIIFNSVQTICQEYEFAERASETSVFYGARETLDGKYLSGQLMLRVKFGHVTEGARVVTRLKTAHATPPISTDYSYTVDALDMTAGGVDFDREVKTEQAKFKLTHLDNTNSRSAMMQRMDSLFADNREACWLVYIENYLVRGVICSTQEYSDYLGGYPVKATVRGGFSQNSTNVSVEKVMTSQPYDARHLVHVNGGTYSKFLVHPPKGINTADGDALNLAVCIGANYPDEGSVETINDIQFKDLISYALDPWF